ncbi:MAG TPA: hypothetical protein DHV36_16145 [Desulfobacteraceae bacterium]|nr:hypothetical protein [Desulfobacteraceae bacterium]|tara:strand:+ start:996 stop:1739 length:744 start_codon:yes stop_codon:yes gene_type:complete
MSTAAINSGFSASIKGVKAVDRYLVKEEARAQKARNTALRVEGYRLKNLLQKEIRQGAPGGRQFTPLSWIARRIWRRPNRKPLDQLSKGVRYDVNPREPYAVAVGFVGPMTWSEADLGLGYVGRRVNQYSPDLLRDESLNPLRRGISRSNISSKKWRRLADMHQEGFTHEISPRKRWWIINRGAGLIKRSSFGREDIADTPFFLRKNTRRFTTPARKIIGPFWQAHEMPARRNIKRNFKAKLAGRRI